MPKKKKYPFTSQTVTIGDVAYNLAMFNKRAGTSNDNNNPTPFAGDKNVNLDNTAGHCDVLAESNTDLEEDKMYVAKHDKEFELPANVHLIDQELVENALEELEPEEEFEVGYITPVYFYKELLEHFTLLKCTRMKGYTGIDYIEARVGDDANKAQRIQIAKELAKKSKQELVNLGGMPLAGREGDLSADYAKLNKTVLQRHGDTILFYPKVGTNPVVTYYIDLYDGKGYRKVPREMLELTILKKVNEIADRLSHSHWDDRQLAMKIENQIASDNATLASVQFSDETRAETRSRISNGNTISKPPVRALYTGQVYYLKTPYTVLGTTIIESLLQNKQNSKGTVIEGLTLQETKRYVRRYYVRPQNIFCSNKAEILKTLIDLNDQNCTVYTLNNLGDEKDVTKLTDKDIIYYYDDGILYDKNHIKIMDYDLYIKNEEEREHINPETASDATFSKVYDDRMTDQTELEEDFNPFMQEFVSIDAYGNKIVEGKQVDGTCCICGEPINGYGNNAEPVKSGRCCDACNAKFVIPARLSNIGSNKD